MKVEFIMTLPISLFSVFIQPIIKFSCLNLDLNWSNSEHVNRRELTLLFIFVFHLESDDEDMFLPYRSGQRCRSHFEEVAVWGWASALMSVTVC